VNIIIKNENILRLFKIFKSFNTLMEFLSAVVPTVISSCIASSMVYPLMTIKTQLQVVSVTNNPSVTSATSNRSVANGVSKGIRTTRTSATSATSATSVARNIWYQRGISGFYGGLPSFLTTYPVFWTSFFVVKDNVQSYLTSDNKYVNDVSSTMVASTVASFVANPFFVVNTRQQAALVSTPLGSSNPIKSCSTVLKELYRQEGYRGLTKGMTATIGNNSKLAVQMPLCGILQEHNVVNNKYYNAFVASLLSKTGCSILFYPMDIIRTVQRNNNYPTKFLDVVKQIYKSQGIRGYYKGLGIYSALTTPNFVIMMSCLEYFKKN